MTQEKVDELKAEADRLLAIYEPFLDRRREAEAAEVKPRRDWRVAQGNYMSALNELEHQE